MASRTASGAIDIGEEARSALDELDPQPRCGSEPWPRTGVSDLFQKLSKLSTHVNAVLQLADVRSRSAELAIDPIGGTPEQMAAVMHADLEK